MVTPERDSSPAFDLSGGRLCLDFVNTVNNRGSDAPTDQLHTYADFVSFAEQTGAVSAAAARQLARDAAAHANAARTALSQAVAVREALLRVFVAIAGEKRPKPADLAIVNARVPAAFARAHVAPHEDRYTLAIDTPGDDLLAPLAPIVKSAVDLLISPDIDRVRSCAAETCAWLFMDTTKNRTRRWCTMKVCGNREKVRRFRKGSGSSSTD